METRSLSDLKSHLSEYADRLALGPRTRGKPLKRGLERRWSARRGDFRVIYRLDEETKTMYMLKIAHRADVYRRS